MNARHVTRLLALLFAGLVALPAQAATTLKLKEPFIEANRDRATLTASFVVDKAHDNPKPASEDGDIHIAGWSDDLDLVTVAEIMNSKKELGAVARANAIEGRTQKVNITGGYRYKKAEEAFHRYETTDFHLDCSAGGATVRMTMSTVGLQLHEVHPRPERGMSATRCRTVGRRSRPPCWTTMTPCSFPRSG